jgi:hypothetical protein
MTEETNALFEALFALEDVREILRETAPEHNLDEDQKKRLEGALKKIRSSMDRLEGNMK